MSIHPDVVLSSLFALIYILVLIYSSAIPQGKKTWWPLVTLMVAFVIAGLLITPIYARFILLNLAALTAAALVWTQPNEDAPKAARAYLYMIIASAVCVGLGLSLSGLMTRGEILPPPAFPMDRIVVLLIMVGFALKLALVPFYFWLPGIASSSSPMTTALIIATVDMAEFGELISLREHLPWVFADHAVLWLILALLSMFGGALLALAQRDIKRMLVFSTIDDMGYLVLGVLSGTQAGIQGAYWGIVSHALFKTLLFSAVGVAERGLNTTLNFDCRGLSRRFPVSSAMFIAGSLGILGIPPLLGFVGRWHLYLAGLESGGPALAIAMMVATGMALFYYIRAIHKIWLGPMPGAPVNLPTAEPKAAVIVMIAIGAIGLLLGLFPQLLPFVS